MSSPDSKQRFSSRVENYVRYRPGYPAEVVELLRSECGLTSDSVVADIAFGTGLFTRLLLENGNRVLGVEPNDAMRAAGEEYLAAYPRFSSVAGSAEATGLNDQSVDLVTAAQAAHWFDLPKARKEFVRILKPGGWVALLWNERRVGTTDFLRAYEKLVLTYGTDYREVRQERTSASIEVFFAPSTFQCKVFPSSQELDYAALEGRLLSSSYIPQVGAENHEQMLSELRQIFKAYQREGKVSLDYDTQVYYSQLQ